MQSSVAGVTQGDQCMMLMSLKPTLALKSLIAVYTPTEKFELQEKEMFYAKPNFVVNQCHSGDTLIVLSFNTSPGRETAIHELCVSPHGASTRNTNNSLLDFAKSRGLRTASFQFQRHEPRLWTQYNNADGKTNKINQILVTTHRKVLKNYCSVGQNAELFVTDQRLAAVNLRIHISPTVLKCNQPEFHFEKLRGQPYAQEYAMVISIWFEVLGMMEDHGELQDTFKQETLKYAECWKNV